MKRFLVNTLISQETMDGVALERERLPEKCTHSMSGSGINHKIEFLWR